MSSSGQRLSYLNPRSFADERMCPFVSCMRCLQSNLAYLAAVADRAHKPTSTLPPAPAILTAPKAVPSVVDPFRRLAALFSSNLSMDSPENASNRGAGSPFAGQAPPSIPTPGSVPGGPMPTPDAMMMADGMGRPGPPPPPPPHVRSGSMQAEQHQQYKRWLGEMGGSVQQVFEGFEQHQPPPQQQAPPLPQHQQPPPPPPQQQHQMPMVQPTGQMWETAIQMNAMNAQHHGVVPSAYPPQAPPFQQ